MTANDVALAAITEGFERFRCTAASNRAPTTAYRRNRWQLGHAVHLPVEYDDPVRRLRTAHNRSQQSGRRQPDSLSDYTPSCCAPR
ncbi:hypothetical protein ACQKB2_18090 [Mycobacterium tuberculosis]